MSSVAATPRPAQKTTATKPFSRFEWLVALRYLPSVRERLAPDVVRRIEAAAQPTG